MRHDVPRTRGENSGLPENLTYVGFWLRVFASCIDSILVLFIVVPLVHVIYGGTKVPSGHLLNDLQHVFINDPLGFLFKGPLDFLISFLFPAVAVILFWMYRSATPGKMIIGAKILDAQTYGMPTNRQLIVRYFGYFLSMLPLLPPLGMVWIAFDPRKQGWHDKLAGTVVVKEKSK